MKRSFDMYSCNSSTGVNFISNDISPYPHLDNLQTSCNDIFLKIILNSQVLPSIPLLSKKYYLLINKNAEYQKTLVVAQLMKIARKYLDLGNLTEPKHKDEEELESSEFWQNVTDCYEVMSTAGKIVAYFNSDLSQAMNFVSDMEYFIVRKTKAQCDILTIWFKSHDIQVSKKREQVIPYIHSLIDTVKNYDPEPDDYVPSCQTKLTRTLYELNLQNDESLLNEVESLTDLIKDDFIKVKALCNQAIIQPDRSKSLSLLQQAHKLFDFDAKPFDEFSKLLTQGVYNKIIKATAMISPEKMIQKFYEPSYKNIYLNSCQYWVISKAVSHLPFPEKTDEIKALADRCVQSYQMYTPHADQAKQFLLLYIAPFLSKQKSEEFEKIVDQASTPCNYHNVIRLANVSPEKALKLFDREAGFDDWHLTYFIKKLVNHKPKDAISEIKNLIDRNNIAHTACYIATLIATKFSNDKIFPFYTAI